MNTTESRAGVFLEAFPYHMFLDIWVEAHNELGTVESEHLKRDSDWFGKLYVSITRCRLLSQC